jgi:hypothetical protein
MGLHVIHKYAGEMSITHTRVEKCGQRGVLGKYCLHFHLMGSCPGCSFVGNAIEYGHQRGIVVHGTHQALVADNVLSDVRGAGIYVEDGNELSNRFLYNVVICPWSREGPLKSCTVPGTDNDQADTSLNHAGLWAHASDNHFVGNRFANSFNGLFIQGDFEGGNGRGAVQSQLCTEHERFGRVSGNTNHGHGRFGTYILGPHFPRNVQQTLAMNGVMNLSTCAAFDSSGIDTGVPVRISDNLDWGNVFVGQYDVGDVQYHHHTSIDNLNLLCIHAEAWTLDSLVLYDLLTCPAFEPSRGQIGRRPRTSMMAARRT